PRPAAPARAARRPGPPCPRSPGAVPGRAARARRRTPVPTRGRGSRAGPGPPWWSGARPSDHRQHVVTLEGGDLDPVGVPLRPLVAQEEVEDVLAEGLGEHLG